MKTPLYPWLTAAVAFASLTLAPLPAHAERGEKTLGVAPGYASYNNSGTASLYFQYTCAEHVRIAPEIGYVFQHEGKSGFTCSADVQFPFRLARGFNVYPLAGITLNNWSYSHGDHATRGGFDIGGGVDLYMTPQFKLNIQSKYSAMSDTGGCFVSLGLGYVF